jgi:hypothetical protein
MKSAPTSFLPDIDAAIVSIAGLVRPRIDIHSAVLPFSTER